MSISLNRSVDVSTNYQGQDGAAHKRLRVDSPTASTSAMGDSSSSNSDSGSLRKSKETIQKEQQIRLAALRETCPLVGPSVMDKSSDVILIKDMIDSIEAAVQAQNSNTSGWYNAHLGKSLQRARLGIPKT
jgi:hypothetical protein